MVENEHNPNLFLYRLVIESLFEDVRVQHARGVMKTMIAQGLKDHIDLVERIMVALLMRGHLQEAMGWIDLLLHAGNGPDFDGLLFVLCEKEKTIAGGGGKTLNGFSFLCKIMRNNIFRLRVCA